MSQAATMKAAFVERLGSAEDIRVGALPVPRPAADEVLVKVEATAVNPVDTLIRSGAYRTPLPGFPFVIGRDAVGEVVEAGAAVGDRFPPGVKVWTNCLGYDGRQGAAAEYAVVPMDRLYRVPELGNAGTSGPASGSAGRYDPVAIVAALHPAATAYLALVRHAGGVGPGDVVVVGGAAGNVGTCVSQLAASYGARVIALARREDAAWCEEHGAHAVVDYRAPAVQLADELRTAAPGGVNVWVDTSGRIDFSLAIDAMADRGAIVTLAARPADYPPAELPVTAFYRKSLRLVGFVITTATTAELTSAAKALNAQLEKGELDVRIGEVLPLEQATEAHRLVESGVRGRVVLSIGG
ncbi:MAG TPA: zinc-binding dehydrogenase [Actinopolymorphaceae bacterium]|jgi:NADPH:quinone reductase-like Zn-dependent oxidoreductase